VAIPNPNKIEINILPNPECNNRLKFIQCGIYCSYIFTISVFLGRFLGLGRYGFDFAFFRTFDFLLFEIKAIAHSIFILDNVHIIGSRIYVNRAIVGNKQIHEKYSHGQADDEYGYVDIFEQHSIGCVDINVYSYRMICIL